MRTISAPQGGRRGVAGRRPERAHRARHRRPRVRHARWAHRARGRAAALATTPLRGDAGLRHERRRAAPERDAAPRGAKRLRASVAARPSRSTSRASSSATTRRGSPRRPTFTLAADFRVDAPADHRRAGPERLRQDDAVRAHHRQQHADRGPRAGRRARHPPRPLPRARPPRDPLSPVVPGARVPHDPARRDCCSAPAARGRSCTCSTSRSSRSRTATSASCWISSRACAATGTSCSSACIRTSRSTSRSCARRASASSSCTRARSGNSPRFRPSSAIAGARDYLGVLAPALAA